MEKRMLGKTGLLINPVGFGGIPIQRISQQEATEVINKAIAMGVNFIDSARGYTYSEVYVGNAIINKRDSVYLATKSMARDYETMKKDIETSLNNFQTNHIDLYQCHNVKNINEFNKVIGDNGAYKALLEAKSAGLINHIGITSHSCDFLKWLINSEYKDLFETIQFPYNFIEHDAIELFKQAKQLNIGTIAMKPLAGGTIDNGTIAIKYLLNDNNLTVAIPGMATIKEVEDNLLINDITISDTEYNYIKKLQDELKNDFCHRCGYCCPCTMGIDIPGTFTLERYYTKYNLIEWAKTRYFNAKVLPSACINCQACVSKCPYSLNIPEKLAKIVKIFEYKE